MPRLVRSAARIAILAAVTAYGAGVTPASASPAKDSALSPHWTRISSFTGLGFSSAGLLRTGDGRLHVVWPSKDTGGYSLHYSTVGGKAKLLATGTIVGHWGSMDQFPRLVAAPHGILAQPGLRVTFDGSNGINGSPYDVGTFYSATAGPSGTGWTLAAGSLSHTDFPPLTDDAAAVLPNGVPVTAWASGPALSYHVGIDPSVPAKAPDVQIPVGPSGSVIDPTLVTDAAGTVWGAWFNSSGTATMGYWADPVFKGASGMRKAPGSGGMNLNNSQPLEPVALATRAGGGEYLAYCVPTKVVTCGHIALWRVGAAKAMVVPGSASGHDSKVAIAAAPGGHLWVLWYDFQANVIQAVRTNAAATSFGPVMTITPPPHLFAFQDLQAEGSTGPLDIVALVTPDGSGSPAFYDAQILPPLTLQASKSKVGVPGSITFTVLDAGTPVGGAAVSFLGGTVVTNAKGVATFSVKKGTKAGSYHATAGKPDYTAATVIVTVT